MYLKGWIKIKILQETCGVDTYEVDKIYNEIIEEESRLQDISMEWQKMLLL